MAWTPTARGAVAALGLVLGAAVAIHVENQDNLLRSVVIIASGGIGGLLLTAPGRRARWREDTGGLKLIALAAMVVDHGGWVFDPATGLWRDVGRLAFPLFAFQVAVGFAHTSSRVRYLTRLLVIAIIAQAPFPYCIGPGLNPLFTLSLALAALWLIESAQSRGAKLLLVALALWLGESCTLDYRGYGVGLVLLAYGLRGDVARLAASWIGVTLLQLLWGDSALQASASLAALLLLVPIPLRYRLPRWAFYVFYPAHFAVLAAWIHLGPG